MKHHPGKGHKVAAHAKQGGGNLKLPKASQSIHVAPKKDNMAGNVGGSAHMSPSKQAMGHQDLIESGGSMKKPKKAKEKY